MNPHFITHDRGELPPMPKAGYARIDSVEFSKARLTARVCFDMVDADWMNSRLPVASGQVNVNDALPIDFDSMPLFHLEMTIRLSSRAFHYYSAVNRSLIHRYLQGLNPHRPSSFDFDHDKWFLLEITKKRCDQPANLFRNMSGVAEPVRVAVLPYADGSRLDKVFTLPGIRQDKLSQHELDILADVSCDQVAVFDVGQGNANGLLDANSNGGRGRQTAPDLFFDAGAGVYWNQHTRPAGLYLNADNAKAVILSHWDKDHWAGATLSSRGQGSLLGKTWIAPDQTVGPGHVAFANSITANGGKLVLLSGFTPNVLTIPIRGGRILKLTQGVGLGRNESGLVACIENSTRPNRSIILTGDCDYRFFSHLRSAPVKGLVVPHHGARLGSDFSDVPKPFTSGSQSTLVYSFGPNNSHGKFRVRHPTVDGVALHRSWDHGGWKASRPGFGDPGPEVLSTCGHAAGAPRGDVFIDW